MKTPDSGMNNVPDLESLPIRLPGFISISGNEKPVPKKDSYQAIFKGVPIIAEVETLSSMVRDKIPTIEMTIKVSTKPNDINNVTLSITISKEDREDEAMATTGIENAAQDLKHLGLGRAMWLISLKLMQKFADEFDMAVTHKVIRMPDLGLTGAKWNELFLPLLNQHGFVKVGSNEWEKVFEPQK